MGEFRGTFSGLAREDPKEYLKDIKLFVERQSFRGEEHVEADRARRAAFRQGLQGRARLEWYLGLPVKNNE